MICDSPMLARTIPFLVPTTKLFILQHYQEKLLFPFDNPQQKVISISNCFSKSSFKDTNIFCTLKKKLSYFNKICKYFLFLLELLISCIVFTSFFSGYTSLFPFLLTRTYLIIIVFLYLYE